MNSPRLSSPRSTLPRPPAQMPDITHHCFSTRYSILRTNGASLPHHLPDSCSSQALPVLPLPSSPAPLGPIRAHSPPPQLPPQLVPDGMCSCREPHVRNRRCTATPGAGGWGPEPSVYVCLPAYNTHTHTHTNSQLPVQGSNGPDFVGSLPSPWAAEFVGVLLHLQQARLGTPESNYPSPLS